MDVEKAPKRVRYMFWVILGAFSTVLPEVIAGSDLYPFFKVIDYLLVIPLYTLHSLVLWYIVWSKGKPRLYNLFPAGAIFGLYEAYMTKVIWNPTWAASPYNILGIAVVETLILVLFWHSFLAFIVPLFIAETALTNSREILIGMPNWISKRLRKLEGIWIYIFPFLAGIFQSINVPSLMDAVCSGLTNTLVLMGLVFIWRKLNGVKYSLRSLLPSKREFRVLLMLLLLLYGLMGVFWRPESLPDIGPQIVIWIMYIFFGGLLYLGLRKSIVDFKASRIIDANLTYRKMLIFGGMFSFSSLLGKASGLSIIAVYFIWIIGIIFGIIVLIDTIRSIRY